MVDLDIIGPGMGFSADERRLVRALYAQRHAAGMNLTRGDGGGSMQDRIAARRPAIRLVQRVSCLVARTPNQVAATGDVFVTFIRFLHKCIIDLLGLMNTSFEIRGLDPETLSRCPVRRGASNNAHNRLYTDV